MTKSSQIVFTLPMLTFLLVAWNNHDIDFFSRFDCNVIWRVV